jgi:superfamily II DNA or RNA helicase
MSNYKSRKDKYIDLKIKGRLFPSYIMANFKSYKLPEIILGDDDPCARDIKKGLKKYQEFFGKYLDFNSPYKNILLYLGLGAGKTASAINIYNVLYNASPGINVYLLIKASLRETQWMPELEKWLQEDEKSFRLGNVTFISYDSPIADKAFLDAIKITDSSKKSLYIIDECHNFIRNVYSNLSSKQGKRALTIYDHIIQDQKENEGTRVVLLSGTPAINNPYELALLFNLLRPDIFPKSEAQFNQEFISTTSYKILNPAKKNMFQRRIMGLVSYYIGATPDFYPSSRTQYISVEMDKYQEEIYNYFENIEDVMARKMKKRSQGIEVEKLKTYTRQACNFVFPFMSQGVSGEHRPRPKDFKINSSKGSNIEKGIPIEIENDTDEYHNIQNYMKSINDYVSAFDLYLDGYNEKDKKNGYTINDDLKICSDKYNGNFIEFRKYENKKSKLFDEMNKCSAKFLCVIFKIFESKGSVLVYSNYVFMEGIQIFKIYLKYFDFTPLDKSLTGKDGFRFTEFHGNIDNKQRLINKNVFISSENKYGSVCKIMLISPAGAEGLNLFNVRQVHLMEPYWNEVRMVQMIGRAIRNCSHKDLPMSERHVDVYRYKSVKPEKKEKEKEIEKKLKNGNKNKEPKMKEDKVTSDQYVENSARKKEGLLQSFLDAIKEVAVDCVLNKNHNALSHDFKCFQFEEASLFDEQIGPAYKEDMYDDSKIDNGSNSLKSETIKIKVLKIKAVKQLTQNVDETKISYTKTEEYWYNPETGVVYDYEMYYPIGKVGYDDNNLPKKLDKDTYIIDKVIPIPFINE